MVLLFACSTLFCVVIIKDPDNINYKILSAFFSSLKSQLEESSLAKHLFLSFGFVIVGIGNFVFLDLTFEESRIKGSILNDVEKNIISLVKVTFYYLKERFDRLIVIYICKIDFKKMIYSHIAFFSLNWNTIVNCQ